MKSANQQILFLGRRDDRPDFDTSRSMATQMNAVTSHMKYHSVDLEDLIFTFDGLGLHIQDSRGVDVAEYDGIFLLGWFKTKILEEIALSVANYAKSHDVPFLNSEALYTRSRSKLSQYVLCALHGISTMPFVFSAGHQQLTEAVAASNLTFPVIAKSVSASRGRDNYLVNSLAELKIILARQPEIAFVVQEFIPNDGDYRLLVMGSKVRMVMHRQSQTDSHLNNTSQGGRATLIDTTELEPQMLKDAVGLAKHLRREVTGIDIVVHRGTGQYYVLEANNMPQLSTGKMVEAKMRALDAFLAEDFLRG